MTNTNTVNIHIFFLHITRGVNQNQHYCAVQRARRMSVTIFMTAGPRNPVFGIRGMSKTAG